MRVPVALRGGALVALLCHAGGRPVFAQDADPHAALPERPSVATHAWTVAPGWLEIEAGFERAHDAGRFGDAGVPAALKLGLAPRVQLTLATAAARPRSGGWSVDDVNVAVKWRVLERVPLVGAVAIQPSLTLPTSSSASTGEAAGGVLAIASRSVGAVAIDVNAGYTRRRGDGRDAPTSETAWAAAAGGPVRGRVGWLGEVYGYPATRGPAGRPAIVGTIVGATAAVTPAFVVDLGVVLPVRGPETRAIVCGAVWNVGRIAP